MSIGRMIQDVRERTSDDDTFLYDMYPFGKPTYVHWARRGGWGFSIVAERGHGVYLLIGKILVTIGEANS